MNIQEHKFSRDHGSLYDRGSADSYYSRNINPHYCINNQYQYTNDPLEIEEYLSGYNWNELYGSKKDYE